MSEWPRRWKNKLTLPGLGGSSPESFQRYAKMAYDKLGPIVEQYPDDPEISEIREDFDDVSYLDDDLVEEFDAVLERLYDWGDAGKRLLVDGK